MEPVTYFIGSGTSILFGAFYVLNRREHSYEVLGEKKHLQTLHKVQRPRVWAGTGVAR